MAEPTQLKPDDRVKFMEFHRPTLQAGDYKITVRHYISAEGASPQEVLRERDFSVQGERFTLSNEQCVAQYPPPNSSGAFHNHLPHIVLRRSTLPWERSPQGHSTDDSVSPSWLALLLFTEDELDGAQQVVKVEDLAAGPDGAQQTAETGKRNGINSADVWWQKIALQTADDAQAPVTVIDVPWETTLRHLLPTYDDLRTVAHVRHVTPASGPVPTGDAAEVAVIMGNRFPPAGKNCIVHLVSLEGWYETVGDQLRLQVPERLVSPPDPPKETKPPVPRVRLVSLKSWRFHCDPEGEDFAWLLAHLNAPIVPDKDNGEGVPDAALCLPVAGVGHPVASRYLQAGYVPLPHRLRQGDKTISWYRGPLVPSWEVVGEVRVPVRNPDELLRFDPGIGVLDASYAAAWELGRLLALQDSGFAVRLYHWKRAHAQAILHLRQAVDYNYLPLRGLTSVVPDFPPQLADWFDALTRLVPVPINYLLPDARLLPPESIRFFVVDPAWLECLRDGAFSIGRVLTRDHRADVTHDEGFPPPPHVSGLLMRSAVVAGWPGLLVDGYAVDISDGQKDEDDEWERAAHLDTPALSRDYPPLRLLRMDRLAPDLLLCLFTDDKATKHELGLVDFHLHPQTLHFGVDPDPYSDKSDPTLVKQVKQLRDPASGDIAEREVDTLPSGKGWARLRFSAEARSTLQKDWPALTSAILDAIDGLESTCDKLESKVREYVRSQLKDAYSDKLFNAIWSSAIKITREQVDIGPDEYWRNRGLGVLNLHRLFDEMARQATGLMDSQMAKLDRRFTAADFGLQMLAAPPLVRFNRYPDPQAKPGAS